MADDTFSLDPRQQIPDATISAARQYWQRLRYTRPTIPATEIAGLEVNDVITKGRFDLLSYSTTDVITEEVYGRVICGAHIRSALLFLGLIERSLPTPEFPFFRSSQTDREGLAEHLLLELELAGMNVDALTAISDHLNGEEGEGRGRAFCDAVRTTILRNTDINLSEVEKSVDLVVQNDDEQKLLARLVEAGLKNINISREGRILPIPPNAALQSAEKILRRYASSGRHMRVPRASEMSMADILLHMDEWRAATYKQEQERLAALKETVGGARHKLVIEPAADDMPIAVWPPTQNEREIDELRGVIRRLEETIEKHKRQGSGQGDNNGQGDDPPQSGRLGGRGSGPLPRSGGGGFFNR